jgi:hypothetical protein
VAFQDCAAEAQEVLRLLEEGVVFGGEGLGSDGLEGGVDVGEVVVPVAGAGRVGAGWRVLVRVGG